MVIRARQLAALVLTLLVFGVIFAPCALADTDGTYTYTIGPDGKATIDRYLGVGGPVSIPATLGLSAVATVGPEAFQGTAGLTAVTIPDSVRHIANLAFADCSSLVDVTFSPGISTVGEAAFTNCPNMASITLPDSVVALGDYAFAYCSGLTSATFLGDAPAAMGVGVFDYSGTPFIVYVIDGKTGFGTAPGTWNGYPTANLGTPSGLVVSTPASSPWSLALLIALAIAGTFVVRRHSLNSA